MKKDLLIKNILMLMILTLFLYGCKSSSDGSFVDQFVTDPDFNSSEESHYFKGYISYEDIYVKGAEINIYNKNNELMLTKTSNEDGEFYIYKSEVGKDIFLKPYFFRIKCVGFKDISEEINLEITNKFEFPLEAVENIVIPSGSTTFSGTVFDSDSIEEVQNVNINTGTKIYNTNEAGEFLFIAEKNTVDFIRENYKDLSVTYELNGIINVNKIVYIDGLSASVRGTVSDFIKNQKISGVNVSLYKDNILMDTNTTNSSGEFVFLNIKEEGDFLVKFTHDDYIDKNYTFKISESREYIIGNFELQGKNGSLKGKIVDASTGLGLQNVAIITGDGNQNFTDSNGNYFLNDIKNGNNDITIIAESFKTHNENIFIEANSNQTENFFLYQDYGNSKINLNFNTSDFKEVDHNDVSITMRRYISELQIDDEDNSYEIIESGDLAPVDITIGSSEGNDNGLNIINLYSGKYMIHAIAVITPDNNSGVSPGKYQKVVSEVVISPGIELKETITLDTAEIVVSDIITE